MVFMKFRVLISLLFIIVTSFTAIHEVKHFVNADDSPCMVCHVNDNLSSADVISEVTYVEIFHFEKILENNSILSYHDKKTSNQNRAPPSA
jgi:hypothetical protein